MRKAHRWQSCSGVVLAAYASTTSGDATHALPERTLASHSTNAHVRPYMGVFSRGSSRSMYTDVHDWRSANQSTPVCKGVPMIVHVTASASPARPHRVLLTPFCLRTATAPALQAPLLSLSAGAAHHRTYETTKISEMIYR